MTGEVVLRAVPVPDSPDEFEPVPAPSHRARGKLSLWSQNELMRELATQDKKRTELAREFGVTHQYIGKFARRYAREIAKIKADLDNEFAHLWSAKKVNRIAVLQKVIMDRLNMPVRYADDDRVILQAERQIADELGQMPTRQNLITGTVTHTVIGFTTDEIRELLT